MRFDTNVSIKIKDAYVARAEPEAQRILANYFWALLVVLFACICVASIGYGVWQFLQPVDTGAAANLPAKKTFTKEDVDTILQGFDARTTDYQTRVVAPVPVKDPS